MAGQSRRPPAWQTAVVRSAFLLGSMPRAPAKFVRPEDAGLVMGVYGGVGVYVGVCHGRNGN